MGLALAHHVLHACSIDIRPSFSALPNFKIKVDLYSMCACIVLNRPRYRSQLRNSSDGTTMKQIFFLLLCQFLACSSVTVPRFYVSLNNIPIVFLFLIIYGYYTSTVKRFYFQSGQIALYSPGQKNILLQNFLGTI